MRRNEKSSPSFAIPNIGWFALLDGGMLLLIVLVSSRKAYDRLKKIVPLPSRRTVGLILTVATAIHVVEGMFAFRSAKRRGFGDAAAKWALQSFIVGFPSALKMRELSRRQD